MHQAQITREELAGLLREAAAAHAEYERTLGHRDEDWPDWYADFIVQRLQEHSASAKSAETQ